MGSLNESFRNEAPDFSQPMENACQLSMMLISTIFGSNKASQYAKEPTKWSIY